MTRILLLQLLLLLSLKFSAQQQKEQPIQLSGIVVDKNFAIPVPFVNIAVKGTSRGAMTNANGFFSLIVWPQEEVVFSSVGYKTAALVAPDSAGKNKLFVTIKIKSDTVQLEEVQVYPWPSKEAFNEAFLELRTIDQKDLVMPTPGIKEVKNPQPVEPTFMNPFSLVGKVVEEVKERKTKKKKAKQLPKFE